MLPSHLQRKCGAAGDGAGGGADEEGLYVADLLLLEDFPVGLAQSVVRAIVGRSVRDYSDETGSEASVELR